MLEQIQFELGRLIKVSYFHMLLTVHKNASLLYRITGSVDIVFCTLIPQTSASSTDLGGNPGM